MNNTYSFAPATVLTDKYSFVDHNGDTVEMSCVSNPGRATDPLDGNCDYWRKVNGVGRLITRHIFEAYKPAK